MEETGKLPPDGKPVTAFYFSDSALISRILRGTFGD